MTTSSTHPLQLYRAILRECTYLPDPRARTFFHKYIVDHFHRHHPASSRWRDPTTLKRQTTLLREGRKKLSVLRRANEGYPKRLEKVLMETYGRQGKRRRELMIQYTAETAPQSTGEVINYQPTERYTQNWKPSPIFDLLVRSQKAHQGQVTVSKGNLRLKPDVPEKTRWGTDLSPKRYTNLMRKWHAHNANLIFPPLPDDEWYELRALARGEKPWSGSVPRRKKVGEWPAGDVLEATHALVQGPEKGQTFEQFVDGRPHKITRRLMRHMYAHVLAHTPRLVMHPEKRELVARWDKVSKHAVSIARPGPSQASLLFGEVESRPSPEAT